MKIKVSPKFSARKIVDETIGRTWFRFQALAYDLGNHTLNYMQNFINSNRKRGGGTGRLAGAMTLEYVTGAGMVSWGIGNITSLNSNVKSWYVVNYGKMITGQPYVPNHGNFIPGSFGGDRPNANLRGRGTERFNYKDGSGFGMTPGTPIRPMNYISATQHQLNVEFRAIIRKLKVTIK